MDHLKGFSKLNRTHSHRRALYKNMVSSLLLKERIETTLVKAKEIRRVVEKIITKARVKSLHNVRIVGRLITDKDILKKLFDDIAPRYKERNGGYTRIIKLAKRKGDGADMAFIELVSEISKTKKKKKKSFAEKNDLMKDVVIKEIGPNEKLEDIISAQKNSVKSKESTDIKENSQE